MQYIQQNLSDQVDSLCNRVTDLEELIRTYESELEENSDEMMTYIQELNCTLSDLSGTVGKKIFIKSHYIFLIRLNKQTNVRSDCYLLLKYALWKRNTDVPIIKKF